jgi:phosphohistidine phosphatase
MTEVPQSRKQLMIVSHNFGITDFANYLSGADISNIPTCGIVRIDLDDVTWINAAKKKGDMIFFEYPKKYYPQ